MEKKLQILSAADSLSTWLNISPAMLIWSCEVRMSLSHEEPVRCDIHMTNGVEVSGGV